jgi:anti-sigma regulatory factor (Ser/Thr protein kinase)
MSVEQARRFVLGVLGTGRAEREVIELLVSELATNAVSHAQTSFEVSVSVGDVTHVEISDGSPLAPRLLPVTDEGDEGGRGLRFVSDLALAWGVRRTPTGKTVWFEAGRNP